MSVAPADSLRRVLDAIAGSDGGTTVVEIGRRTGLEAELVRLAIRQLVVLGALGRDTVELSCVDGGCTGCPSAAGVCATAPGTSALVLLTVRSRTGTGLGAATERTHDS